MNMIYSKIRIITAVLLMGIAIFVSASNVNAVDLTRANNKFGIHLAQPQEDDLRKAAELVNSQGGQWGYVTLVIQEDDRNKEKWQGIFNIMRELHLIPIIRLATKPEGNAWRRPVPEDVDSWVNFLDSLNWVVKDRYVILFNEPNHALEWGGSVDATGYARIAKLFAQRLKAADPDFVIMLAGIDASAPAALPNYQDEALFLEDVLKEIPASEFNDLFSALSSHSYPNPGFAGPPLAFGRGTVRTYRWEMELLRGYGVKDLPVFITETGWNGNAVSRALIGQYTKTAMEAVWMPDQSVVAVTPFILNYQGEPFAAFSYAMPDNKDYYPQYYITKEIPKSAGIPEQIERGESKMDLPTELLVGSIYRFPFTIKNTGQTIWDRDDGYAIRVEGADTRAFFVPDLTTIKPMEERQMYLYAQTIRETPSRKILTISLYKGEQKLWVIKHWNFDIDPLPSLTFHVRFFPPVFADSNQYELQIFDDREQLVFKKTDIQVTDSTGIIEGVPNVLPGRKYRVVILRPHYAPRQIIVIFDKEKNDITFPWMLPIDFNIDGKFDGSDIRAVIEKPKVLARIIGAW